jgi:hypothetical protein
MPTMSLSATDTIAWTTIGGLSKPSKMPGRAFSLPAAGEACPIGTQLTKVKGTVCSGCYALKGNYRWPQTRAALERRFLLVKEALAEPEKRVTWLAAMVQLAGSTYGGLPAMILLDYWWWWWNTSRYENNYVNPKIAHMSTV